VSTSAQAPPDPNYQRQQIFPSYQDFKTAVTAAVANPAQLDALWTQLRNAGQIPYAQGNQVALLYRGAATSVSFAGDFNGWNPNSQWQASSMGGNVWLLEKNLAPNARIDYKVILNGNNWINDPGNPLLMWSGLGTANSELRMPQYIYPQETVRQAGVARGALTANIRTASARLGYDVNYRVYTPAGYAQQQLKNLPVVYVTDGHEYSADHLGSMLPVLDNLIAAGTLQPTIAVFIDPRDPTTGENRRGSQYTQNANFAGFVADELVPRIDAAYRTLAAPTGRTILGTSLGGINSAYFGATRSDVFENIAIQSPAGFSSSLTNIYNTQPLQSKLDLFVTVGTVNDGGTGASFASLLENKGYDYAFIQMNEGHSWGQWRALLDNILIDLIGPPVPEPSCGALLSASLIAGRAARKKASRLVPEPGLGATGVSPVRSTTRANSKLTCKPPRA
jgi:enterochelin esterase family protein